MCFPGQISFDKVINCLRMSSASKSALSFKGTSYQAHTIWLNLHLNRGVWGTYASEMAFWFTKLISLADVKFIPVNQITLYRNDPAIGLMITAAWLFLAHVWFCRTNRSPLSFTACVLTWPGKQPSDRAKCPQSYRLGKSKTSSCATENASGPNFLDQVADAFDSHTYAALNDKFVSFRSTKETVPLVCLWRHLPLSLRAVPEYCRRTNQFCALGSGQYHLSTLKLGLCLGLYAHCFSWNECQEWRLLLTSLKGKLAPSI